MPNGHMANGHMATGDSPKEDSPERHMANGAMANGAMANGGMANGAMANGHMADEHSPDRRSRDRHSPESDTSVQTDSVNMRSDLQDLLHRNFPHLHRLPDFLGEDGKPLFTQLHIGDGWFVLYFDMCKEIEDFIARMNLNVSNYQINRVEEEPFSGLLHIDFSRTTDGIEEAWKKAEARSSRTCAECGRKGRAYNWPVVSIKCIECRSFDMRGPAIYESG